MRDCGYEFCADKCQQCYLICSRWFALKDDYYDLGRPQEVTCKRLTTAIGIGDELGRDLTQREVNEYLRIPCRQLWILRDIAMSCIYLGLIVVDSGKSKEMNIRQATYKIAKFAVLNKMGILKAGEKIKREKIKIY